MTNVLGTTGATEDQFKKLTVLADKLGLDLLGLTDSYKSFAGATITAGLSQAQTNAIFNAFSTAGAAMKLSTDDINGALRAVSQMFSKGTVSAEELRGQLGERLPGAFAYAAKVSGYTTEEFGKLMAQGKILASDVVPKMAAGYEQLYGSDPAAKTDNLQASLNRLNNTFTLAVKEGNVGKFFKMFVDGANQTLKILESSSWSEFFNKLSALHAGPTVQMITNDVYDLIKALDTLGNSKQLASGTFKFTFTATELTKDYSEQIDLVKKLAAEMKNTAVFGKLSTAEQAKKVFQLEKERQLMTELGLINKNKKSSPLDLGTIGGLTEKIKQLKEESQSLKGKQLIDKQTQIEKATKDLKDLEFYAKNINGDSLAGLDYRIAELNQEASELPVTSSRLASIGVELSKLAAQNEIEKKTTELNKFRNGGRLKYANGGNPWEFQQFEDSPINVNSLGNFRGSTANYGIGDFNYVDDRLYTETPGANDYPVFKNSGNYPIKPKTGSYSSVDYANDEVFPHNISQGRTLSEPSRDRSKDYLNQLGINDPTQPSYIPSFDPFEGSDQTYDFNDVTLPSPIKSKFEPTVKRSDQLPQRELGFTQSTQEDLSKYDDFLDKEGLKDRNKFGYAEAGLLASNMAGVDNLIKSMKPAQTKFDRVKLDRLDLSTARDLNARNSALGQRISQANVRNNATSSGQALSTLAASNGALTNQRINADLSTMLQEEQANNQITNQERSVNNQISREEYIANEQNRANAQSTGNFALSSIGNNFQGYAKDKVLTKNDIMGNKRMMEVLNQMSQNYQWNVDPESDQLMIKYISKLANQ